MAATDGISAVIRGLPDLKEALAGIVPKLRRQALRNALAAGARVVRDDARAHTPLLQSVVPYRTRGTVRRAISVRTSKIARRAGDVGVFVNVRPNKKGNRGAKNKTDPFYWRFIEFGTVKMQGAKFLQGAARRLPEALEVFKKTIGPAIQKLNAGKNAQP